MSTTAEDRALRDAVQRAGQPLTGEGGDYDGLMDLIGEASHGTHGFYHERARITQRLIDEKEFSTVAVEADWPDACRANRYARGDSNDGGAAAALADFRILGCAILGRAAADQRSRV